VSPKQWNAQMIGRRNNWGWSLDNVERLFKGNTTLKNSLLTLELDAVTFSAVLPIAHKLSNTVVFQKYVLS
jgi:hypothetical protein